FSMDNGLVLVKKVFISSKPTFVCLLCPPPCGPFSIQESAAGGLSYKVKKRQPFLIVLLHKFYFTPTYSIYVTIYFPVSALSRRLGAIFIVLI
ncbi:MAG: hypothetical protein SOY47_00775, partial [Lachnospiraceae bacterium]|nr:hypothetical protein [Lachnospiraceae bacterium]